jgi:quercetin 2,3-dioxygenase
LPVRRVLPQHPRHTVGSWCFVDHAGPVPVEPGVAFGIGPHPHMGLQTVTWFVAGELLHLDSLGSEQLIRPGQLNLMTAGHGVSHAEEDPARAEEVHAVQLSVAQPADTRDGPAAFEHHAELPRLEFDHAEGTVLVGDLAGVTSPARCDTDHMGAELRLRGPGAVVPLRTDYEHALVVLEGRVTVDGVVVEPGVLSYLGSARDECRFLAEVPARALLLGGVPFPEAVLMWWNFVGRRREELSEASGNGRPATAVSVACGPRSAGSRWARPPGVTYRSPRPEGLTVVGHQTPPRQKPRPTCRFRMRPRPEQR